MIFSSFPAINYQGKPTTDIFRNYNKYVKQAAQNLILRDYQIEASDRPELISWKLYGNSQYYWIILMMNDNYDPFHGWIKAQDAVHESTDYKYEKAGGSNQIAYHVNAAGRKFYNLYEDPDNPGLWYDKIDKQKVHLQYNGTLVPITVIEDEIQKNEDKRYIKIVSPEDLNAFMSAYKRIVSNV